MLDPVDVWIDEFSKLPPAETSIMAVINLANIIEKLTNKVEPNAITALSIVPGTFIFNKATFIAQLVLIPTAAPDWIPKIATAWMAGCTSGFITPSTVIDPITWPVSTSDVSTVPLAATTIPTMAAGQSLLISTLSLIPSLMLVDPKLAQETIARAFYLAVSSFSFTLIGLSGTPISPVPTPITVPAK